MCVFVCAIVIQTTAIVLTAPITPPSTTHTTTVDIQRYANEGTCRMFYISIRNKTSALPLCWWGTRAAALTGARVREGAGVNWPASDAPGVWMLDATKVQRSLVFEISGRFGGFQRCIIVL